MKAKISQNYLFTMILLLSMVMTAFSQAKSKRLITFEREYGYLESDSDVDSMLIMLNRFSQNDNLTNEELKTLNYSKGLYYKHIGRYQDAVDCSKKALKFKTSGDDSSNKFIYYSLADNYFTMQQYDMAYEYAIKAKPYLSGLYIEIDNSSILGYCLFLKGQYAKSLIEYEIANQLTKEYQLEWKSPEIQYKIAKVYDKMGNFKKALNVVNHAIAEADSSKLEVNRINTRMSKYSILQNNQKYKEANMLMDEIRELENDYAFNKRNQKIDELEAKYQNQLKTQQNESLKLINKQNNDVIKRQRIILYGTVFAILVFSVLIFYLFKFSRKQEATNSELALQKDQIEKNNKELLRLNVLNQKIFSVISHDFKGPITTLKLLLSNKEIEKSENPVIASYIKEIGLQLEQSDAMLESLLDWAKTELNIKVSGTTEINLNDLVEEVIKQLETKIKEKNINVRNAILEHDKVVFPTEVLRIVLRNIINNALKFSNPNGIIEVYCIEGAIKVRDYGSGIPEKKMDKLFKQVTSPGLGTNQESGFGLGLYLSYELMQKNKGDIKVENHKMGGCTFSIILP
ncbi:tetratricopeptide repeat-containing sensor histidine kinase [Flavobacterium terrisoli]|uniref:tetratricopeptide repeat-containing sensor histidine kinase n=1 Tax=Flavobacterium terrisoli TaxID=3242195 RepID=UPI002542E028|nr:HAMP domain-containing sensor histidine kinase [Flavobacterium buctense]